jgi:Ras-related protein Rab-4B
MKIFFSIEDLMFIETSAATSENVAESFLKCARVILSKIESGISFEMIKEDVKDILFLGSIDPYRMYSGIQCGRSLAANRTDLNQNENSANDRLQKSSKGCALCHT